MSAGNRFGRDLSQNFSAANVGSRHYRHLSCLRNYTSKGDSETDTLTESDIAFGLFTTDIPTSDDPVATDDSILQVENGTIFAGTYNDADNSTVTDTTQVQALEDIFTL